MCCPLTSVKWPHIHLCRAAISQLINKKFRLKFLTVGKTNQDGVTLSSRNYLLIFYRPVGILKLKIFIGLTLNVSTGMEFCIRSGNLAAHLIKFPL